jgi:hypothetical protein
MGSMSISRTRLSLRLSLRPARAARSLTLALLVATPALLSGCDKGPPARGEAPAAAKTEPAAAAAAAAPAAPAAAAVNGKSYGAGVKLAAATPMADILKDPSAFQGKTVRVEGMISDVCPQRGCWMELAGENAGEKLRFKVEDGDMVFPLEAKGQYAVTEGVVAVNELNLEDSKKYAEYQAKEYGKPYDPASITTPTRIVRLDGVGAVLRDQK